MAFKTFTNGSVLTDTDLNTYLMKQAVVVCTSGTRPSTPPEGMTIYETDTDKLACYNGSAWVYVAGALAWTAITGWAAGANADGTMVPQYTTSISGRVELRGRVNATTTFSGSGVLIVTLPSGARPNVNRDYAVARNFSSANTGDCKVNIQNTGDLTLYTPTSETSWFALDGIFFYTS